MASKYRPDYAACKGAGRQTFGTLYHSMLTDKRFIDLPMSAKVVYMACRVQATSKNGRACLYKHAKAEGTEYADNCFVFPTKQQREYGFKDRGNFSRSMQTLIDEGFIDKVEDNKHRWKTNIYKFSSKWSIPKT